MTSARRGGRELSAAALRRLRARAGSGLLLTILALVVVTTAIVAGTVGYGRAAATTAARQAVTETASRPRRECGCRPGRRRTPGARTR